MTLFLVALAGFIWGALLNWWAGCVLADAFPQKRSYFYVQRTKFMRGRSMVRVVFDLFMSGKFGSFAHSVLWKFPLFEGAAAGLAVMMWQVLSILPEPTPYHFVARIVVYGLLLSGLFVATRTDLQEMVIPQMVLIGLVPVALIGASMGLLTVPLLTSLMGGVIGYGSLWLLGKLSHLILKKDGIGIGDIELLGVLGLFVGPIGVWAIVLTSSLLGTVGALLYLIITRQGRNTRIPFGPFLALSAVAYLYAPAWYVMFLLGV